jgi:hypothetical protein
MQFVVSYSGGSYSWSIQVGSATLSSPAYPDLPSALADMAAVEAGAASAPISCPPPTVSFTATPPTLPPGGGTVTLSWQTTLATSLSVNGTSFSAPSGSEQLAITSTAVFNAVAFGPGGTVAAPPVTVTVASAPPPAQRATIMTAWDAVPNFGANPTVWTTRNGKWSDPGTWSTGALPTTGDVVAVQNALAYDVDSAARLTTVTILSGGWLAFRTDIDTQLLVQNLLVNVGGAVTIGTAANPIADGVTATVEFLNAPLLGTDVNQYGNGLLVFGSITTFGQPRTGMVRLAAEPKAGDAALMLLGSVTDWQPGDRLVLSDSRQLKPSEHGGLAGTGTYVSQSETVTIASIAPGNVTSLVALSTPLAYDHLGARDSAGSLRYCPWVANETRNVVFRSEAARGTRGYSFFTGRAAVNLQNAGFYGMGRATVALPGPSNLMQRHAVTFSHLLGPVGGVAGGIAQYVFAGNAVTCPLNPMPFRWGIDLHASHFGLIQDNVVHNWAGAGICEDTVNVGNVFNRNFVAGINNGNPTSDRADRRQGDVGYEGVCYWFCGFGATVTNNVGAGGGYGAPCSYGYTFAGLHAGTVKVPTAPGQDENQYVAVNGNAQPLTFNGNEACGAMGGGFTAWWLGTLDVKPIAGMQPSVVQGFTAWHCHLYGVYRYNVQGLTISNLVVLADPAAGGQPIGCWSSDYVDDGTVLLNPDVEGCATGIITPKFCASTYLGGTAPGPKWGPGTFAIKGGVLANRVNVEHYTIGAGGAHPAGADLPARTVTLDGVQFGGPAGHTDILFSYLPPAQDAFVNVTALDTFLVTNATGSQTGSFGAYWSPLGNPPSPPVGAAARAGIVGAVVA